MLARARAFWSAVFTPPARLLLRLGVPPNAVTAAGTIGVCAAALLLFPTGHLFWGALVITVFVVSDTMDGVMARMSGQSSTWGAFLDSTLDRFGDAAVFGGLLLWFTVGDGNSPVLAVVTLWCLVTGSITSYIKARAEALGMQVDVGISQRADRLVLVLVGSGLSDLAFLHIGWILPLCLWVLAAASAVTVVQRLLTVRSQATRAPAPVTPAGPAAPGKPARAS